MLPHVLEHKVPHFHYFQGNVCVRRCSGVWTEIFKKRNLFLFFFFSSSPLYGYENTLLCNCLIYPIATAQLGPFTSLMRSIRWLLLPLICLAMAGSPVIPVSSDFLYLCSYPGRQWGGWGQVSRFFYSFFLSNTHRRLIGFIKRLETNGWHYDLHACCGILARSHFLRIPSIENPPHA